MLIEVTQIIDGQIGSYKKNLYNTDNLVRVIDDGPCRVMLDVNGGDIEVTETFKEILDKCLDIATPGTFGLVQDKEVEYGTAAQAGRCDRETTAPGDAPEPRRY